MKKKSLDSIKNFEHKKKFKKKIKYMNFIKKTLKNIYLIKIQFHGPNH